eukprot:6547819-Prymnesium_polylepis.2
MASVGKSVLGSVDGVEMTPRSTEGKELTKSLTEAAESRVLTVRFARPCIPTNVPLHIPSERHCPLPSLNTLASPHRVPLSPLGTSVHRPPSMHGQAQSRLT